MSSRGRRPRLLLILPGLVQQDERDGAGDDHGAAQRERRHRLARREARLG